VGLLIACVFVFGFALIVPFLSGTSGIMGLVIIGIALYEAWKITRSVPPVIRGPFQVGDGG
jgi:hypothetical protein